MVAEAFVLGPVGMEPLEDFLACFGPDPGPGIWALVNLFTDKIVRGRDLQLTSAAHLVSEYEGMSCT